MDTAYRMLGEEAKAWLDARAALVRPVAPDAAAPGSPPAGVHPPAYDGAELFGEVDGDGQIAEADSAPGEDVAMGVLEADNLLARHLGTEPMALIVERIHPNAKLPRRTTSGSAGMDLYSPVEATIPVGGRGVRIQLGIKLKLPDGTVGYVEPRSGLTFSHDIHVGAGVIDQDYRGEIGIHLYNLGGRPYTIKVGER